MLFLLVLRNGIATVDDFQHYFEQIIWQMHPQKLTWNLEMERENGPQVFLANPINTVEGWNLAPPGMYETL